MRDRLIELIQASGCVQTWDYHTDDFKKPNPIYELADHLIANGVIVPPVKVGQTVWISLNGILFHTHLSPFNAFSASSRERKTVLPSDLLPTEKVRRSQCRCITFGEYHSIETTLCGSPFLMETNMVCRQNLQPS